MKIKTLLLSSAVALMALSSCVIAVDRTNKNYTVKKDETSATLGGKLFTSAWIQRSAEYQALCQQGYTLAKLRLDEAIAKKGSRPLAIITDIDETIIDNSPNAVHQALRGEDYTDKSWDAWCDRAEALPLAGSQDFFRYADSRGVTIFYISNRSEANRAGTIRNMQNLGYPQVRDSQFLLRTTTSDKTARRSQVAEKYDVVLLLGDNLGDFEHVFDSSNELERMQGVNTWKHEFGRRFIVFPNPNYGTWEKAMNGGYPPLEEKDRRLKTMLKTY